MAESIQQPTLIPAYICNLCGNSFRQDDPKKRYEMHDSTHARFMAIQGLDLKVGEVFGAKIKGAADIISRAVIEGIPNPKYDNKHRRIYFMSFYHVQNPDKNVFEQRLYATDPKPCLPLKDIFYELSRESFNHFIERLMRDAELDPHLVKNVETITKGSGFSLHRKNLTRGKLKK